MRPSFLPRTAAAPVPRCLRGSYIRHGRVLIECCVSVVLVAGAGALTLLVTANTAHLVDETRQRDRVLGRAAEQLARVTAAPCLVGSGSTREVVGPRAVVEVIATGAGRLHTVTTASWWQASGWRLGAWRRHTTTTSGWCE